MLVRTKPSIFLREIFSFVLMIAAGLYLISELSNNVFYLGSNFSSVLEYNEAPLKTFVWSFLSIFSTIILAVTGFWACLLYTSDAADE